MQGLLKRLNNNTRAYFFVLILALADMAALLASIVVAMLLRFDDLPWEKIYNVYLEPHLQSLPFVMGIYLTAFAVFRLYRCAWRFASLETLWGIILANFIGLIGMISTQSVIDGSTFPRSVLVMVWASGIVMVGALRILLRVLSLVKRHGALSLGGVRQQSRKVIILGAGANGAHVLREVREDPHLNYSIIGFLDDDSGKIGTYINGVKVLGPLKLIEKYAVCGGVDEVILAIEQTGSKHIRESVMACRENKVPVKVIPNLRNVLNGENSTALVDFSVEDLLRRDSADADVIGVTEHLAGKRVLVTGAGGSIGSELCRQIASHGPSLLILLGHGENPIYEIYQEIQHTHPEMIDRIHCVIASVANRARISQTIKHYRPQFVFHAAAHKHVPMMETNEQEAVHNNVLGAHYLAEACGKFGVERIVLISTDKAADPHCIMGATKWICEEVFRAAAIYWPRTAFVAVRFGNVLGSSGSVVPTFCEQIKRGGPLTITHPDMTRYFMTIPEAVRLVLSAGAVGKSGELYLLDMGEPMKIVDLARDLIRLCGYTPDVDIAIEYTGIRPGEKMHERLISSRESIAGTSWEGISLVNRPEYLSSEQMMQAIEQIEHLISFGSAAAIRRVLHELVPNGHKPSGFSFLFDKSAPDHDLKKEQEPSAFI